MNPIHAFWSHNDKNPDTSRIRQFLRANNILFVTIFMIFVVFYGKLFPKVLITKTLSETPHNLRDTIQLVKILTLEVPQDISSAYLNGGMYSENYSKLFIAKNT